MSCFMGTRGCILLINKNRWKKKLINLPLRTIATHDTLPLPPSPPPTPSIPDLSREVSVDLNALGEPTLQSLGLGSWWPSGIVQQGLELIHVNLDIPWWQAIVMGTVCLRFLTFPLVIFSQKNSANLHNHMPIIKQMQSKFERAKAIGNPLETAKKGNEMMGYMKENKINPLKSMMVPFIQLPVFVSVFIGIRKMANLPVVSMVSGGTLWFTDLTTPDPYYLLPLITMATFAVTMELGVDGVKAESMSRIMKMVMRGMPLIIFPFTINFPSGLLVYWLTSNMVSLGQVLLLKIPGLKVKLGIPELVKHKLPVQEKKSFLEDLKSSWKKSKGMVNLEQLQKDEAIKFKEAGMGALKKTYYFDPTKKKLKLK